MTSSSVQNTHMLFKFLRRLRVMGLIETKVESRALTEFGRPVVYSMSILKYHPGVFKTTEEHLEELLASMGYGFDDPGSQSSS